MLGVFVRAVFASLRRRARERWPERRRRVQCGAGTRGSSIAAMAAPEAGEALICCSYPRPSSDTDELVLDI